MNKYYFKEYKSHLYNSISNTKDSIFYITPYLVKNEITDLFSNIQQDSKINFISISNFTENDYISENSNLDIVEFLIENKFNYINTMVYKAVGINSKIIIIDNIEMYIIYPELNHNNTNNLTVYTDNYNDIKKIVEIFSRNKTNENIIKSEDIHSMQIVIDNYNKTTSLSCANQAHSIKNDLTLLGASISDGIPEEELLSKDQQFNYNNISNFIESFIIDSYEKNTFLQRYDSRIISDKEHLEVTLEELNIAKVEYTEFTDVLENIFGQINFKNNVSVTDLACCFIHPTWAHKFNAIDLQYSISRKNLYYSLGYSTAKMLFATKIAQYRSFRFDQVADYSMITSYMIQQYNYEKALKKINCNKIFYKNDASISRNVISKIYFELIGFLVWNLDFEVFYNIFSDKLDLSKEYIFSNAKELDYKTYFQELAQSKSLQFEYKEINSFGEDHNKTFETNLYVKNEIFGVGVGHSKKDSQTKAAEQGIKKFLSKFKIPKKTTQTIFDLKPYVLSKTRMIALERLSHNIELDVNNFKLLDIALTHVSMVKNHPYLRPNNALSFIGSYIDDLCRHFLLLNTFDTNNEKSMQDFKKGVNIIETFSNYYNMSNLNIYANSSIEISDKMKMGIIQALIGVFYIEKGFTETLDFVSKIWKSKIENIELRYVNEVQECLAKQGFLEEKIDYRVLSESGLDNNKIFKIICYINNEPYGIGEGRTKKNARENAAKDTFNMDIFKKNFL